MDANPFRYGHVDESLVNDLFDEVIKGNAAAVFGAPWMGRSVLLEELSKRLKSVSLEIRTVDLSKPSPAIHDDSWIARLVSPNADFDVTGTEADTGDLRSNSMPILWIMGFDQIPQTLARTLVVQIREFGQERRLGVILSSHSSLQELVDGPNSAIDCTLKVVIQGLGQQYFVEKSRLFCESAGHRLSGELHSALWQLTGGNTYLLRLILLALIERSTRAADNSAITSIEDIQHALRSTEVLEAHASHVLQTFLRLIRRHRSAWSNLELLLSDKRPKLNDPLGPPGALTLGGVAKRNGQYLYWASPLMASIVKPYMTATRLADLYALDGDWREAFARYEGLPPNLRARPLSAENLPEVEDVVNLLCLAIGTEGALNPMFALQMAISGCRHFLGFRDVWVWEGDTWRTTDDLTGPSGELLALANRLLRSPYPRPLGHLELPEPWKRSGMAWLLRSPNSTENVLIIAGDFEHRLTVSLARRRSLESVLTALQIAWKSAPPAIPDPRIRDTQREALDESLLAFAADHDPKAILRAAASRLRSSGYRRVLFCLVTPDGKRIKGELDDSEPPRVDVAIMTDFDIAEDKDVDVQAWVAFRGEKQIFSDARGEKLANPLVVKAAAQAGLAVLPIKSPGGPVLGTLHVERNDRKAPSDDEIEKLEQFCAEIGVLLAENQKFRLMQSTIDRIADPILISDLNAKPIYVNPAAGKWLSMSSGWVSAAERSRKIDKDVGEALQEAITGQRSKRPYFRASPEALHGSLTADCLLDADQGRIGAFVDLHNQRELYLVFEALQKIVAVQSEDDLLTGVFGAFQALGHSWGRLYVNSGEDEPRLIGRRSFGFESPEIAREFDLGGIPLGTRNSHPSSWKCIELRKAVVFRQARRGESERESRTPLGQNIFIVNEACDPRLRKDAGSYWIDLPLFSGERAMGKITLECTEQLPPERLELLYILSRISTVILAAIEERERIRQGHEATVNEAAEKSIAVISHNLATRLAGLAVLRSRYELREKDCDSIRQLNTDFKKALASIQGEINHAKEMFRGAKARRQQVDLKALLIAVLQSHFRPDGFDVDVKTDAQYVFGDEILLTGIYNELCQNSKDAVEPGRSVNVKVSAERVSRDGVRWLRMVYEDNGPGIAPELKNAIFEDFFTARAHGKSGMGLGLTYVKKSVQAHEGLILEDGRYGDGARFVIEIPSEVKNERSVDC